MRIDSPAEDDAPCDRFDNHAADTHPTVEYQPVDRAVLAAEYRSAVDAAYRDYKAATPMPGSCMPMPIRCVRSGRPLRRIRLILRQRWRGSMPRALK